jgi:hypothetical protein
LCCCTKFRQHFLFARFEQSVVASSGQRQGDLIERIFVHGEIVFWQLKVALFSSVQSYVCINFDQKLLGYIFGDFFTNSSGHTGPTVVTETVSIFSGFDFS